eukprot:352743-Chlamydomonas_euryale.AAC.23
MGSFRCPGLTRMACLYAQHTVSTHRTSWSDAGDAQIVPCLSGGREQQVGRGRRRGSRIRNPFLSNWRWAAWKSEQLEVEGLEPGAGVKDGPGKEARVGDFSTRPALPPELSLK